MNSDGSWKYYDCDYSSEYRTCTLVSYRNTYNINAYQISKCPYYQPKPIKNVWRCERYDGSWKYYDCDHSDYQRKCKPVYGYVYDSDVEHCGYYSNNGGNGYNGGYNGGYNDDYRNGGGYDGNTRGY